MSKTMANILATHRLDVVMYIGVGQEHLCICGARTEDHDAHQAGELVGAGYGDVKEARIDALGGLLTDEALERARQLIEAELIEWRDECRFMLRNNGLAVRNKDGSGSEIIRFGFEMGLRMVINDHMAAAVRGEG